MCVGGLEAGPGVPYSTPAPSARGCGRPDPSLAARSLNQYGAYASLTEPGHFHPRTHAVKIRNANLILQIFIEHLLSVGSPGFAF